MSLTKKIDVKPHLLYCAKRTGMMLHSRFGGFYIANVTMDARQIQQSTSLDIADKNRPQPIAAR
jgi:hypothetical protein